MKTIDKMLHYLSAAILVLLISACQVNRNLPTNQNINDTIDNGYPISIIDGDDIITNDSLINNEDGYPPPIDGTPITAPEINPDSSFGVVHGRLLNKGIPVDGYNLYLADIITDNQGMDLVASVKRSSSPQAILDQNGVFVFNNLVPGRYGLIFFDGVSSYLLLQPDTITEEAIIIDVSEGDVLDLGELDFYDFPLD